MPGRWAYGYEKRTPEAGLPRLVPTTGPTLGGAMEFQVDLEAHAAYLVVQDSVTVARTVQLSPAVLTDLDAEGNVIGVEILDYEP